MADNAQENTQENRQLELVTPLGKDVLLVTGATVHERISGLFSIDLDILSEDPNVDFESILGKQVTLKQGLPDDNIRFFNGFVGHFKGCGIQHGLWAYTARVYPWLWFLTHTCDCRIFQNQKVPDIIRQIFDDLGFNDYEIRLTEEYKEWEYCVQYRESDFHFVSRLMEHEGIFYFFTHEEERHTLVLADSNASLQAFDGFESIPFSMTDASGGSATQEAVRAVHMEKQIHPGSFTQRDFDFKVPQKDLTTLHAISREHDHSEYEVYDYPGHYVESSHGEAYTKARIESIRAGYETVSCESDARGISSGFYFDLSGHPGELYNKRYLVTSVEHRLSTGSGFQSGVPIDGSGCNVFFQAIDFDTPYRPAMKTRKPVVEGPQTAIVCGPKGDEIYTDEYGRVKVQFHWDREGRLDENSSCWIRVSQLWAGKKWGAMYIPRITQEVIVEFLEGDPDQPIVTGRVYNGKSMPPYDLPAEKTKSTIKSDSSKGGNGFNEIRFEDKKGDEQVFFHAEKNMDVHVKNDSFESILGNRHQTIGSKDNSDQIELIHGDKHLTVIGDRISKIQSNDNLTVEAGRMVAVQGDDNLSVKGDLLIKADGTISLKGTSIKIEASSGFEIKCGGSSISVTPSALFLAGGPVININSGSGPPVSGASPAPPDLPKEPKPADNAKPGEPFEEPARPAVSKPEAPAAKILHQAAEDGAPFCEECERARQEREKKATGNLKSKEIEQP